MAASVTSERPGKRDRLIAGARETIYRQGVEATTIADIAEASDVPLGNVQVQRRTRRRGNRLLRPRQP
jgi:TetR/AcrR family transcriptional regulator, transcriptional repressor for nem operon